MVMPCCSWGVMQFGHRMMRKRSSTSSVRWRSMPLRPTPTLSWANCCRPKASMQKASQASPGPANRSSRACSAVLGADREESRSRRLEILECQVAPVPVGCCRSMAQTPPGAGGRGPYSSPSASKFASSRIVVPGCRRPTALGCGRRHHLVTFRSIPSSAIAWCHFWRR